MFDLYFSEDWRDYPECLPCPQVNSDITPRERRYISDVGDVKKMRRFQSVFQATRQNISFIFTQSQARMFLEWYKYAIIEGGLWFRANWPILHKDKDIPYRFASRPVWEFLANRNYHVSATVEIYEARKVSKVSKIVTSALYPYNFADDITDAHSTIRSVGHSTMPSDNITAGQIVIAGATLQRWLYSDYSFSDEITSGQIIISNASLRRYIYSQQDFSDDISSGHSIITSGAITQRLVTHSNYSDAVTSSHIVITSGAKS